MTTEANIAGFIKPLHIGMTKSQGEYFISVRVDGNRRISMTGESDTGSGQCIVPVEEVESFVNGWNAELYTMLLLYWDKYHLKNGTIAVIDWLHALPEFSVNTFAMCDAHEDIKGTCLACMDTLKIAKRSPMYALKRHRARELLRSKNVAMTTEFVPFRFSRNKNEKQKNVNWRVTVGVRQRDHHTDILEKSFTFEYSQGIGTIPHYDLFKRDERIQFTNEVAEYGTLPRLSILLACRVPYPQLADIFYSLVMDASAIDHIIFEDWAESFGYDADSREAEKIYNACRESGVNLIKLIGRDGLAKLQKIYEEF
jgi:hypothetical protein